MAFGKLAKTESNIFTVYNLLTIKTG